MDKLAKRPEDIVQRMFTPERLEHIAKSDAEIDAGEFYTGEQLKEQLAQVEADWMTEHRL